MLRALDDSQILGRVGVTRAFGGAVANTNLAKTSRLTEAQERLDRAIARLEKAVAGRANGGDALTRALAAVRDENRALREVNDAVGHRLDAAIDRLRQVLEG